MSLAKDPHRMSPPTSTPEAPAAVPPVGQSSLGSAVAADLEALRNDVESARELALEYQCQLAGKSNEFAQLKQIFEKTQVDLTHLRKAIAELRDERHRLANEAMRATAFERRAQRLTEERDKLFQDLDGLRREQAQGQAREAQLHEEIAALKLALAAARSRPGPAPGFSDDEDERAFIEISFRETASIPAVTRIADAFDDPGMRRRPRRLQG